jgi:hypothetical protein
MGTIATGTLCAGRGLSLPIRTHNDHDAPTMTTLAMAIVAAFFQLNAGSVVFPRIGVMRGIPAGDIPRSRSCFSRCAVLSAS